MDFQVVYQRGKEMIIKYVVTVLPNHVMSCFRIPKTVIKKLTSTVTQFWWSPEGNTKSMHWKSWNKPCIPKDEWGLGFNDLTYLNTTMLEKQFLRFIDKPNTLFSRVFKWRYFRNASPLEPIRSYSSSYDWRSIISARFFVSKWLIKRVGSRSSISIWNDPWLSSTRPRLANKNQHNLYMDLTMDSLINVTSRTWNLQVIQTLVDHEDVKIIESILLSRIQTADRDGWHFTNNEIYIVKSGYQIERVYPDIKRMLPDFGPSISPPKAFCWKVCFQPKMKHILWQLVSWCIEVKKKN